MNPLRMSRLHSGFTLIELVVVIVILGILAATALPRFSDLTSDARIAKMKAAQASLQTAAALVHSQWLVMGSPNDPTNLVAGQTSGSGNSVITMEGQKIAFRFGYPDVGGAGDLLANTNVASPEDNSGVIKAAGGLTDYVKTLGTAPADLTTIVITPDVGHPNCKITYVESTVLHSPPTITAALATSDC